jgi:hypothetical protein
MSDSDENNLHAVYQKALQAAKDEHARLNGMYQDIQRRLTEAKHGIAVLEKLVAGAAPARASRLIYGSTQFKGMAVPTALKKLLLMNPGWHTQADLTDALLAGGLDTVADRDTVRGRVKQAFRYWKRDKGYAISDEATSTWQLTDLGRRELSEDSSEPEPPSGQSLFAEQR